MPRNPRIASGARPPWWALVIAVALSITIITLDAKGGFDHVVNGAKHGASDVLGPVDRGVADVLRPIGGFFGGAVHGPSLEQQNQKLRDQLARENNAQAAGQALEEQLQQLEQLDNVPGVGSTPTVDAQVVADSVSDFSDAITIDKGTSDGIDLGMPVVGDGGLVGLIVEPLGSSSATVQLIDDVRTAVDIRLPSGSLGLSSGKGDRNPIEIDDVVEGTVVHDGDVLSTGGLQFGRYPIGIPVARVKSVSSPAGSTTEVITADPIVDFGHLEYVSVMLWPPSP